MNKKLMLSAVSLSLLTPTIASANMDTGQTIDDTLEEHEHKWNTQINGVNMNVIKGLNSTGELTGTVQLQIYVDETVFNDLTKLKFSTNISEFKLKPLAISTHGTYIYEIPYEKSHEIETLKVYSELTYVNTNFNKSTIELAQYNYEKAIPLYDEDVVEDITYVEGNGTEPIIVPPKEELKPKPSEQKPTIPQKQKESNQESETKETNKTNSTQNNATPKKPNSNIEQKNNESIEVFEDTTYNSSSNSNNMSEVVSISKEDTILESNKDKEVEKDEDVSEDEREDSKTEEIVEDKKQDDETVSTVNDSEVKMKQRNQVENKDLPKTNTETKIFPLILGAMLIVVGGFVAISQRKRINKE